MGSVGTISSLSLGARVELMNVFNSLSLQGKEGSDKGLLSLFPPEIANDIEEEVYKYNMEKVLEQGTGIYASGGQSMSLFKYRKDKINLDISSSLEHMSNSEAWNNFNYDGFIRGKRLSDIYNNLTKKDEKMFILMKMGMCNLGYSYDINPFGIFSDCLLYRNDDETQQRNIDLQFRMWIINCKKHKTLPEDVNEQLDKEAHRKQLPNGSPDHTQQDVSDFENKVKVKKELHYKQHYLKIKCKNKRLLKGKLWECEDISKWFREDTKPEIIYWDIPSYYPPYLLDPEGVVEDFLKLLPYFSPLT